MSCYACVQRWRCAACARLIHDARRFAFAQCKFGTLVKDERCGDIFEALVGTLRAAKKRKVIAFEGEMLLQGARRSTRRARCGCGCARAVPGHATARCALPRAENARLHCVLPGAHDHVDVVLLRESWP